jgi:SAM-dependent methyltransferase
MTSTPSDFARLFQSQYADFNEDIPMWLELVRRHGAPVLELGCGTGRVLGHLADAGHSATGIDANMDMLDRAKAHLQRHLSQQITLRQADLRNFSAAGRFPLAVAPLNVFAELNDGDLSRALSNIRDHLTPDGVLAFELPNPRDALALPADDGDPIQTFTERDSGHAVQVSAHHRLLPSSQDVIVTWHYDELLPDGMVARHRFETTFHLRTSDVLRDVLGEAGYTEVRLYGDYAFGSFDKTSKRLVVVAEKQT